MALRNENTQTNPTLFLDDFFLKQHASYTKFNENLKQLIQAADVDIKAGKFDKLIEKSLELCTCNKDRFLLHKLAYTLFSGFNLDHTLNENSINQYKKVLAYLLYDNNSEIWCIKKVLKDAYDLWKKSPSQNFIQSQEEQLFRDVIEKIYDELQNLKAPLTRPLLRKIFHIDLHNNDFFNLEKTFARYLSPDTKEFKSFLALKKRIKDLNESDKADDVELISAEELIQSLQTFEDLLMGKVPHFCTIPLNAVSWYSKNEKSTETPWSHGGGLFFFSSFLLGENKGYPIAKEDGGLGIYFDPSNGATNYGDEYYAKRYSMKHFDVPISVKCHFLSENATEATTRHTDEAVLRYTHREEIQLKKIKIYRDVIRPTSLRPLDLQVYSDKEDIDLRMQICKSAINLQNIYLDEWKDELKKLQDQKFSTQLRVSF